MKNIFLYVIIFFTLVSCQSEVNAPMGIGSTFIKIISTDARNEAIEAIPSPDGGYILLANVSEVDEDPRRWIKLVKTDAGGNQLWTRSYFAQDQAETANSQLVANNFIPYKNGYLIIGDSINSGNSSLFLSYVNDQGLEQSRKVISAEIDYNLSGKSLLLKEDGNMVFILSVRSAKNDPLDKQAIIALTDENLNINTQPAINLGGNISLTNNLLLNPDKHLLFGGNNHVSQSRTNFRIIEADSLSQFPSGPELTGKPHWFLSEIVGFNDRVLAVGEKSDNADFQEEVISDRIIFLNARNDAITENSVIEIQLEEAATGYSVTRTQDGFFAILGTIGNQEDQRELVLLKTDGNGSILTNSGIPFKKTYGGNGEKGATILQSADGGFLLYGTTRFGGIESLLLIKTNSNGDL
ncbi:MAG: hypothetical protein ACNS60_03890 [Candidatus Cyclobacteriaceae bacterium M2_1C_046]